MARMNKDKEMGKDVPVGASFLNGREKYEKKIKLLPKLCKNDKNCATIISRRSIRYSAQTAILRLFPCLAGRPALCEEDALQAGA